MEYFHAQDTLFAMSDKRKYIKNTYAGKKRKAWNKEVEEESDKGSYYNQGKWIIEHEYGKGWY